MGEIVVSLNNVSKCFKRYARPVDRLQEILLPGKSKADEFWALRNIDLEIYKGQTVGIVGRNGCGKSTLLQILARTLQPTTGEIIVNGRVSALLELGSGFNMEFTGRQNVFFNGRLLGLSQKEIENKFDEIAAFADIGDFIDQPVKTYSSGMFVRLAFAVAVNVAPEVLIVDEALAVGDIVFQHRCMRRMRELMDSGVTTLFVSHDASAIKTLCNYAVMLNEGKIYTSGLPNLVIIEYMKLVTREELGLQAELEQPDNQPSDGKEQQHNSSLDTTAEQKNNSHNCSGLDPAINIATTDITLEEETNNHFELEQVNVLSNHLEQNNGNGKASRRGSRKAVIEQVKLLNRFEEWVKDNCIFEFNEEVTLIIHLEVYQPLQGCIVGFFVCNKNGVEIIGSNTFEENIQIGKLEPGDELQIKFKFKLPLKPDSYSITVAGSENYSAITFDWIDNAMVFQVLPPDTGKNIHALVDQPIEVNVIKETRVDAVIQV